MSVGETERRLAAITDAGAFERLATAILRESDSDYQLLAHPGVNPDGKTVKSPVDGIMFLPDASPPHIILVHHTICARDDLQGKWLHDPATVQAATGRKPAAPAGDVLKAIDVFNKQRTKTPGLRGTLILTTNREPSESLIRDAHATGAAADLVVKFWTCSNLAHFLDVDPTGQWIRRKHLGIEQERLSPELLRELSKRSLECNRLAGNEALWVDRALDRALADLESRDVVFVVAESGQGKSVACRKRLSAHIAAGGYGLVLPHDTVAGAMSLGQAVDAALRQLEPSLAPGAGNDARAMASEHSRLHIVIEDINRAAQPAALIERLVGWSAQGKDSRQRPEWQILCPVWPRVLTTLGDEMRKRVDALVLSAPALTLREGAEAVRRRCEDSGVATTKIDAEAISKALGNDPLLIALHDPAAKPDPSAVIGVYIESSVARLAASRDAFTAAEYSQGLRSIAAAMLQNRNLDPAMIDVRAWLGAEGTAAIRQIALSGEVLRVVGKASAERLSFRHDRVRDWLLADAAADMLNRSAMPETLLSDPYFAEVLGGALVRPGIAASVVKQVGSANVLALVCAAREFGEPVNDLHRAVIGGIESWAGNESARGTPNSYLRWEALRFLSEIEASYVKPIVEGFDEPHDWWALRARFRNGDVGAGLKLCLRSEPGVRVAGHTELIRHVQSRSGSALIERLGAVLRSDNLTPEHRIGALRLAGHLADPALAGDIEASWQADSLRDKNHLDEYLWACAQCCGSDPGRLLDPVCDAWAALPDKAEDDRSSSPRTRLAAHDIRSAFQQDPPVVAIGYFIERARTSELRWPITYMLHGIDHPDAAEFVVREIASQEERLKGTGQFSPFAMSARDHWRRRQQDGRRPMSSATRERLFALWQDAANSNYLRDHAFRFWSSTVVDGDVAILRAITPYDQLAKAVLVERLRRGDRDAIPLLIEKLKQDRGDYWWQMARHIWSDELSAELEEELIRRSASTARDWDFDEKHRNDWITSDLVMRLPQREAEEVLLRHWEHLRFSPRFVQAALHVATPRLAQAVAQAASVCPSPKALFLHILMHIGVKVIGHPGVARLSQIQGLLPYLDYFEDIEISQLWELCNDRGWYELRRQHLDHRLKVGSRDREFVDEAQAIAEFDDLIAKKRAHWIDHWAREYLKTGVTPDQLINLLRKWLQRRNDIAALRLAADVAAHFGRRAHVDALSGEGFEPAADAAAILANASYTVRRRSLM